MYKEQKQTIVRELSEKLADSHFYIANSQGLNVEQVNQIRLACRQKNIHYQVVKNTLLARAINLSMSSEKDKGSVFKVLKGASSIFITQEHHVSEPAKIIRSFRGEQQKDMPVLKCAVIDGELFVGADHLNFLSSVKSKEQVLLELLMLLQVPASRFLMVLKMPGRKVIGMIEALANKLNT